MSAISGGVGFSGASYPLALTSQAAGDLLIASSASAWGRLAVGAAGTVLAGGSTPAWSASPSLTDLTLSGTLHTKQGTDLASGTTLTLPAGNVLSITGSTTVNGIVTTGKQDGDIAILMSEGAITFTHNSGAPGASAVKLRLRGQVNWASVSGDILILVLSTRGGVQAWYEVARTSPNLPGFTMVADSGGGYLAMGATTIAPSQFIAQNLGAAFKFITGGTTTGFAICDANFAAMLSTSGLIGGTPRILLDAILKWPVANVQATVGAAGGASALPATPTGYTKIDVNGTVFVQPYYAA